MNKGTCSGCSCRIGEPRPDCTCRYCQVPGKLLLGDPDPIDTILRRWTEIFEIQIEHMPIKRAARVAIEATYGDLRALFKELLLLSVERDS